jgi:hypothetical protein
VPIFHGTEFGKQIVLDGRELVALEVAKEKLEALKWPAEEKKLANYWVGFAETNSHYVILLYRKPTQGNKSAVSGFRTREYMIKVDRKTMKPSNVVRRQ